MIELDPVDKICSPLRDEDLIFAFDEVSKDTRTISLPEPMMIECSDLTKKTFKIKSINGGVVFDQSTN